MSRRIAIWSVIGINYMAPLLKPVMEKCCEGPGCWVGDICTKINRDKFNCEAI